MTQEDKKLRALTTLLTGIAKLTPDREAWDIEGDWKGAGRIFFISARQMEAFEPFEPAKFKSLKLVNLDRPAIALSFFSKHKYKLVKDKDLSYSDKVERVEAYLSYLDAKIRQVPPRREATLFTAGSASVLGSSLDTLREQRQVWQEIRRNLTDYELITSTYRRGYTYLYVNFKYRLASGELESDQAHLLNDQKDALGNLTQRRFNVVFVDEADILRPHPHQHKEVELYLAGFPIQSVGLKEQLLARPRTESRTNGN